MAVISSARALAGLRGVWGKGVIFAVSPCRRSARLRIGGAASDPQYSVAVACSVRNWARNRSGGWTEGKYSTRINKLTRRGDGDGADHAVASASRISSVVFALNDTLTNNNDYPKEYQALYHSNFSTPFLEQGARFATPVKQVSPFNDKAKGELSDWQTYRAPTRDYDETVYNVVPYADAKGDTLTVLHNKAARKINAWLAILPVNLIIFDSFSILGRWTRMASAGGEMRC